MQACSRLAFGSGRVASAALNYVSLRCYSANQRSQAFTAPALSQLSQGPAWRGAMSSSKPQGRSITSFFAPLGAGKKPGQAGMSSSAGGEAKEAKQPLVPSKRKQPEADEQQQQQQELGPACDGPAQPVQAAEAASGPEPGQGHAQEGQPAAAAAAEGGQAAGEQAVVDAAAERAALREAGNRNNALAKLAVNKAAKEGRAPGLKELLVEASWVEALGSEMSKPYFKSLQEFVHGEWAGTAPIYPPKDLVFRALNSCPLDKVRVVILGQDPYFNPNQAHGLCFSVNKGVRVPPSLINIYKELAQDCGCSIPQHGDLSKWAQQGVLMLNAVLTVRGGTANSHKKKGWEAFTDAAISAVSSRCAPGVVFMLWGKPAQEKARLVNSQKHHVLMAPHPSPLAAASGKGFVGCKHFSQANALLAARGRPTIDWQIE